MCFLCKLLITLVVDIKYFNCEKYYDRPFDVYIYIECTRKH